MIPRTRLGRTSVSVSRLTFGAGPVSGLMTGSDRDLQRATVQRALELGVNWFDTAAGYGNGSSESNLGQTLADLDAWNRYDLHVATKVRIDPASSEELRSQVRRSVEQSLERLQLSRVTLLQLHNGITDARGDEPASLSVDDILGSEGALDALQAIQDEGLAGFIGLTGTGHPESMRQVIRSGQFDTIQLPYNLLNPSAGQKMPIDFVERNYGDILADCAAQDMGGLAIRVFAAGALLGHPPSAHTLKTPYFPLDLYQRDANRAREIQGNFPGADLGKLAVRFALAHPAINALIIGFGKPEQIDQAAGVFSA